MIVDSEDVVQLHNFGRKLITIHAMLFSSLDHTASHLLQCRIALVEWERCTEISYVKKTSIYPIVLVLIGSNMFVAYVGVNVGIDIDICIDNVNIWINPYTPSAVR